MKCKFFYLEEEEKVELIRVARMPLSDTPRSNLRGCWQGVEGNFGGVDRVLVKVPECLKKDFRSSRVQNTPRILVLF